jgi:hypothetical protein
MPSLADYRRSNANLSKADQVRVGVCATLGVMLFVAAIFAGVSYMAQRQETDKRAAFAADSAASTGAVIKKFTEDRDDQAWFWDLDVSWSAPDGAQHEQSFRVPQATYDRYDIGAAIPVTYVRSQPTLWYVDGAAPDADTVPFLKSMQIWEVIAAVLLAPAFLVSAYMARNVGKGPSATPVQGTVQPRRGAAGFGARASRP